MRTHTYLLPIFCLKFIPYYRPFRLHFWSRRSAGSIAMRQDLRTYSSEYPFHDIRVYLVAQPWSFQRQGTYFDHRYGQCRCQRSLCNRRYCDSAHVLQPKLGYRIPAPALPVLAAHRLRFRWHGPPVPRLAICHAVSRCSRELCSV